MNPAAAGLKDGILKGWKLVNGNNNQFQISYTCCYSI